MTGDQYPRVLNGSGCLFGQANREKLNELKTEVAGVEKKIDRMTWALVSAAIGLMTAAVMLALNLWAG